MDNITDVDGDFFRGTRYLILDRDAKYFDGFRNVLVREGRWARKFYRGLTRDFVSVLCRSRSACSASGPANSSVGASELGDLRVAPGNRLIDLKRSRLIGEGVPRRGLLNLPRACCAGAALKMPGLPSDLMRP
jgi:hypothetical protein